MTAFRKCLVAVGLLTILQGAAAAGLGISGDVGTTGVGIRLHTPLGPHFAGRLGANAYNYSFDSATTYATYDVDTRFRTIDALIDWHPMRSGLRFTGGLVFNNSKINTVARPSVSGSFTFNGNTYSVADIGVVEGQVDHNRIAPYLGIGWGSAQSSDKAGWSFTSDVGVMYLGRPQATLRSSGCNLGGSLLSRAICNRLATDLPSESGRVEEEIKDYRFYPVVRIGVMYRF